MANKKKSRIGDAGEAAARKYLEQHGYHIRHINWRYGHYELDIVAEQGQMLIIVEVKTRDEWRIIEPEDAIDNAKIRRTVSAADAYIRTFDLDLPVQFDILSLIKRDDDSYHVEHLEDAFYAPAR